MAATTRQETELLTELRRVRDLLIVLLLKSGATSQEVNYAARMGAANIRAKFPVRQGPRKSARGDA